MQQSKSSSTKKDLKQLKSYKELPKVDRSTAPGKLETKQQSMPSGSRPVTPEQIAKRAFEIWNERGQPSGSDLENWLEAERELLGLNRNNS